MQMPITMLGVLLFQDLIGRCFAAGTWTEAGAES